MDKKRILQDLQRELSPKRLEHTLGVAQTARELAGKFGADAEKAELAALLHDRTREKSLAEQLIICEKYGIITGEMERNSTALLHSATAAAVARECYGAPEDIVSAIACHTVGRVAMTPLDKALCLADYIEPSRDFPGVDDLRRTACENPDRALLQAFDGSIRHLLDKGIPIHPATVAARNDLLRIVGD